MLLAEDELAVADDVELAVLARDDLGLVRRLVVQLGRETRGPAVITVSDGAVEDLDLHTGRDYRKGPDQKRIADVLACAITQTRAAPRRGQQIPGRAA